jgi:hypothetical protein
MVPIVYEIPALDAGGPLREPTRGAVRWRRRIDVSEPRLHPEYHEDYYAVFLRDPDGLRLEVVNHLAVRKATAEHWDRFPPIDEPAA